MAYILNGTTLKRPNTMEETNNTQVAQQRTLSGAIGRDYFGSNKRVWKLSYRNCNYSDFATIDTLYDNYLTAGAAVSWQITETNYTVASTNVHIDLADRSFKTKGTNYLSDFDLILTEA